MRKKRVKWGLIIALIVIAAALGVGVYFLVQHYQSHTVNVYDASMVLMDYGDYIGGQTDGTVSTEGIQSVYVSSTQQVTEVYVTEGQEIHVGDPILAYDTTLTDVELERARIKVEQLQLDLDNANALLAEINTYCVGSSDSGGGGGSYTEPTPSPTPEPQIAEEMPFLRSVDADGTSESPLIYMWNEDCELTDDFLTTALTAAATARGMVLPTAEPSAAPEPTGSPEPTATPEASETPEPAQDPENTQTPVPTAEPEPTQTPEVTAVPDVTAEPENTETPAPTDTPQPTAEPEITPVPEQTADQQITPEPETPAESTDEEPAEEGAVLPVDGLHAPDRKLKSSSDTAAEEDREEAAAETGAGDYYIVFQIRGGDEMNGDILSVWEMCVSVHTDGTRSIRFVVPSYTEEEHTEEDADEEYIDYSYAYDTVSSDDTVYYTAAEIAEKRTECQANIRDLTVQLKLAQVDYERKQYEMNNGVVYSKLDGTIAAVRDIDEARENSQPVVLVSAGGGYYITSAVSEMDLGDVQVGDFVTVTSWENADTYEGTIAEISEYPDESGQYAGMGDGNQNVSYYPIRVFVSADAALRDESYVSVSFDSQSTDGSALYLENAFLRQDGVRYYVLAVGDNGMLEKRYVHTGDVLYGEYTRILEGLTMEDYIAFPYGQNAVEGASVVYADISDLYGY